LTTFGYLLRAGVLNDEDLQWGTIRLLGQLEDLALDCPHTATLASEHLQGLVSTRLLTDTFLRRCENLRIGGAAGLAVLEMPRARIAAGEHGFVGHDREESGNDTGVATLVEPRDPAGVPGAYLCATQRWLLVAVHDASMDATKAMQACLSTASYLVDEGQ